MIRVINLIQSFRFAFSGINRIRFGIQKYYIAPFERKVYEYVAKTGVLL
jgi:hypothetical protein